MLSTLVTHITNFYFLQSFKLDFKVHISGTFHDMDHSFYSPSVLFYFHSFHFNPVSSVFVLLFILFCSVPSPIKCLLLLYYFHYFTTFPWSNGLHWPEHFWGLCWFQSSLPILLQHLGYWWKLICLKWTFWIDLSELLLTPLCISNFTLKHNGYNISDS